MKTKDLKKLTLLYFCIGITYSGFRFALAERHVTVATIGNVPLSD